MLLSLSSDWILPIEMDWNERRSSSSSSFSSSLRVFFFFFPPVEDEVLDLGPAPFTFLEEVTSS